MNLADLLRQTSTFYSSRLRTVNWRGIIFNFRTLPSNMQPQTESNGCRAATSTSVSHFYWAASTWTQCKVAGAELGLSNCCQNPAPGPCNVPWYLDRALTRTENWVSISAPISFAAVRAEIDAGRPVGARIGWSGGGGHFMVIYGYSLTNGTEYFDIDDPIYGKSHLTVSGFSNHCQTTGNWTHSYLTKSYLPFMIINPLPIEEFVLRRIWEARRLLDVKRGLDPETAKHSESLSLGLAHKVFSLGLNALATGESYPEPVGVRVMEIEEDRPRAFFDVTSGAEGEVRQMSADGPYLQLFPRALEVALAEPDRDRSCDLRLLCVPALNFEAVWLHSDDSSDDFVIPLRSFHGFKAMQRVPYTEAISRLQEAARAQHKQDDTMGA